MEALLGLGTDFTFDWSIIIWSIVGTVFIIILYYGIKIVAKNYIRKKEREEMNKNVEVLFEKYSDIFIDKLVNKLNNNNKPQI